MTTTITWEELVDFGLHGGYGCPLACPITMELVDKAKTYEERVASCDKSCPFYTKLHDGDPPIYDDSQASQQKQTQKSTLNNYYVYVYIDPRNFDEFYFGKGIGSRKEAHLSDTSDSEKAKRISAIHNAGLKPIIRVIARDLSEHDAFLIEKTLLWKLGRQLTNISSGHYSENFRSHDTMHLELSGFDFQCGLYYYNVGEDEHRNWDDYKKFGFISAGQGKRWKDAMLGFKKGDVIAAYLKGHGFVGIGKLTDCAKPIRKVQIHGKPLLSLTLSATNMAANSGSDEYCEYVAPVEWLATVERNDPPKWKSKSGLFTSRLVRASLDGQSETITYLEQEFGIKIRELIV